MELAGETPALPGRRRSADFNSLEIGWKNLNCAAALPHGSSASGNPNSHEKVHTSASRHLDQSDSAE